MTKEYVVSAAHEWLGTRFKHQGRIKINDTDKGGCDCLGLIIGLNIKSKYGDNLKIFDQLNYPRLITSNILLERFNLLLDQVEHNEISPGDILLIKINNWPQHLAIVTSINPYITIIHSYLQARRVVKQYLTKEWKENIVAVYRF